MQPAIEVLTDSYIDQHASAYHSAVIAALQQAVYDLHDGGTLIVSGPKQMAFATLYHSLLVYKEPQRAEDVVDIQSCYGVNSYGDEEALYKALDYADSMVYGHMQFDMAGAARA